MNDNINFSEMLPDYIEGRINDDSINKKIQAELILSSALLKEYELLKESYQFLSSANFEEPPAGYFNNLLPSINNKLQQKEEYSQSLISKTLSYWKYLLPVLPVVLIFIIYKSYFVNPGTAPKEITSNKVTNNTTLIPEKVEEDKLKNNMKTENNATLSSGFTHDKKPMIKSVFTNPVIDDLTPENNGSAEVDEIVDELQENSPYIEESTDEINEFDNLNNETQDDILEKLKNSDL